MNSMDWTKEDAERADQVLVVWMAVARLVLESFRPPIPSLSRDHFGGTAATPPSAFSAFSAVEKEPS